jgi:hypothetical protein
MTFAVSASAATIRALASAASFLAFFFSSIVALNSSSDFSVDFSNQTFSYQIEAWKILCPLAPFVG